MDYFPIAQFRTCLWPCVGRWASGQEAGQPPKEETLLPCSRDRQPEAKPAMPALNGRRGLKQRRKGFFGYCRRECRGHRKGLSIFASSAERDLPHPDQGSNHGGECISQWCGLLMPQEVHLGGNAASRIRESSGNDHTYPRI